jgi:hypothetical protein
MAELGGAEIAGIKMHAPIDVTFRRNHIHHCLMGIWCDWEAQGTRITQNLFHDNQLPPYAKHLKGNESVHQDIFVEVGHGPTLIDNNILLSKVSLRIATQGVALVHNLVCGSFTSIDAGTAHPVEGVNRARYTPYHIPHRTEVMGFMTILHGDDRFYNNIFVQKWVPDDPATLSKSDKDGRPENREVGNHVWNEYPTYEEWIAQFDMDTDTPNMGKLEPAHFRHLPIWAAGNVYLNGAKPWAKERQNLVAATGNVSVELREAEDGYYLDTNLYDLLGDFRADMISSDTLGKAFEPEQRFENPDGTDIVFDRDYNGEHRGVRILPGPFVKPNSSTKVF